MIQGLPPYTFNKPLLIIYDDIKEDTMSNESNVLIDLDNLDSIDITTIEAAPDFIDPPAGRYIIGCATKMEIKDRDVKDDDGEKTGETKKVGEIRFTYDIKSVVELKDKKALVPETGSLFSEKFTVTPEGLKYWKQRTVSMLGDLGNASLKEVNNEVMNHEYMADVKTVSSDQKLNDGTTRTFTNVRVKIIGKQGDVPFDAGVKK